MRFMEVAIEQIELKECPKPDKHFLESVKSDGIKIPPILEEMDFGKFRIHDGKRRCYAAEWSGMTAIPALVCSRGEFEENEREYLTLITNLHRSPNPGAELRAVQDLMKKGNLTLDEIAKNIKVPIARMKKIYKLANLCDEAISQLAEGNLRENQALQLARLPREKQQDLIVRGDGRVTGDELEVAIREHNLSDAQPAITGIESMLPAPNPMLNRLEELANMVMASPNVTTAEVNAIEVLRRFVADAAPAVKKAA